MSGHVIGARRLQARGFELSGRDWAILGSLRDHRFLSTRQLARWHFADHRSTSAGIRACIRVLTRLSDLRLVARLDRTIGGLHAGSKAFVWTLDVVGDRLLRQRLGESAPRQGRRFDDPSRTFLDHTLAVAEMRVRAEEAARRGDLELLSVETEPACWRDYVGPHGQRATLKPDLELVTATGDFEDHWFVEVDRGTESVRTLLAKCGQYASYRQTGREQATTGVFPLVAWVMPDPKRRDRLQREIEAARALDPAVFAVITADGFLPLLTEQSPSAELAATPTPTSIQQRRNP